MSDNKTKPTTKENSSNYFAFVGLSFFSGSVAMTIGGGLSGNPLLIAAAGIPSTPKENAPAPKFG